MYVYAGFVGGAVASDKTVNRTFAVPIELDARFRKEVGARMGIGKGALSDALAEAINDWLQKKVK
jgi:hypothetical protein